MVNMNKEIERLKKENEKLRYDKYKDRRLVLHLIQKLNLYECEEKNICPLCKKTL